MCAGTGAALQTILRSTVRAQGLAGFFDGQEYAGVRIPGHMLGQRAMQRKLAGRDLDDALRVVGFFGHGKVPLDRQ